MEITPLKIELHVGHTDKDGVVHTDVTFGRRNKGRDLFALDEDPQGAIQTQYNDLIIRQAITKFGTLPLPVTLETLLGLHRVDCRLLSEGYNRFTRESAGDLKSEFISASKVRLGFGFKMNEIVYDVVTFGKSLTGYDDKEADLLKLTGYIRSCYLIGKEIVQLSQSNDGPHVLDGPVKLEDFNELDLADIYTLITADEAFNQSFFRTREKVPGERRGDDGSNDDDASSSVGTRDSVNAAATS